MVKQSEKCISISNGCHCRRNEIILAIETSCDETSAAVVKNGREVLSNIVASQIEVHKIYGGVVPEIASRKHVELIIPVIDESLNAAGVDIKDVDMVAVTNEPGLIGALLVGISAAKAISIALNKPLIQVNHIHGHISANYIENRDLEPPFVCLVASGGHSNIVLAKDYNEFETVAQSRDDAVGEVFDKIARVLGLGYPGGPAIDKLAKSGDNNAIKFPQVTFGKDCLDFSFSGLKTAVINHINNLKQKGNNIHIQHICASFQKAAIDILIKNLLLAAQKYDLNKIAVAGGVASNSYLRERLNEDKVIQKFNVFSPSIGLCTDNAAMIGCAAYYKNFMKS